MPNVLQGSDHSTTIDVSDAGGLAGLTLWLRAQADGFSLTQADSGKLITPADGGGAVALPTSPAAGTMYDFATLADDSPLTIAALGLHRIMIGSASGSTAVSGGGGGGCYLRLVYAGPNAWVGLASGTWNLT